MKNKLIKVIITGGPGSGKTTIINELKSIGYRVIPESANIIIGMYKIKPSAYRQRRIQENQIFLENLIQNESGIFFLDQGLIDINVYNKLNKCNSVDKKIIYKLEYYNKVFVLDNLDRKYYPNNREESYIKSKKINKKIISEYHNYGFEIIKVKKDTIENRIKFIINNLKKY